MLFPVVALSQENKIIDQVAAPNIYTITVYETPKETVFLRYVGRIGYMTSDMLVSMIEKYSDRLDHIQLSSPGGNLRETIDPGIAIRNHEIPIKIREGDACVSACAYLALYSPDIDINGLLAFHRPYFSQYDITNSIYDISQSTVTMTISLINQFFDNGWKTFLYYTIATESDDRIYVVFDNEDELNKYRFEDPANFMDDGGEGFRGGKMFKLTNEQIQQKLKKQVDNLE